MFRILIVDDMKESRLLLEHYLLETPYSFLSANNGIEAISAFKNDSSISLILMDMEMPVMDGYTAARTISALAGQRKLPIIAMTAHEGEHEVKQCLRAGCTGYLSKPVTHQSLMKALSEHLKAPGADSYCDQVKVSCKNSAVEIDPDIAELVPVFLNNRKRDAEKISELLAEGNFKEIRIIGHSMAGSAGGYGFPEIGKLGRAIETAALASRTEEIKKSNSMLMDYITTVTVGGKD